MLLVFRLSIVCCFFVPLSIYADEGMWTFDHLPLDKITEQLKVKIDSQWIDKAMKSSVRLANGCSGSFVSSQGLVMTNHHCVRDCIYRLSSAEKNWLKQGFQSPQLSYEKQCPALEINRLVHIENVTSQVQKTLEGLTGEPYTKAKNKLTAELEKQCATIPEKQRCDLVELYRGGEYHLYKYERYSDVRLVFAPEQEMGHFGGDPDNFNFPRYAFDVSFLRVYSDGKPLNNSHFFTWSKTPIAEGDATFITGHPGSTQRLLTVAQLQDLRDHQLPNMINDLSEMRGQLHQLQKKSSESRRLAQAKLGRIENGLKAMKGRVQALRNPDFFAQIEQKEDEFRRKITRFPWRQARYGNPWADIENATSSYRSRAYEFDIIAYGIFDSELFLNARNLLRYHQEITKDNSERLKEFTDSRLPQLKQQLLSAAPIYDEMEILSLEFALTKMREKLGVDHPFVKKVLGASSPEDKAKVLVSGTRLKNQKFREQLLTKNLKFLEQQKDSMLQLALALDEESRSLRKLYEGTIESQLTKAAERIAQAQFAILGKTTYPDATFSLRLSYGQVMGWKDAQKQIKPFTQVDGLYQRATGREPFALPGKWIKAEKVLNPQTHFNFVSTNDIIGGNSGSPVINKNAEIVGLVFDGNIHSLGGAYAFDAQVNRAVSVDSSLILEVLDKVYGEKRLLQEIITKP